MRATSESLYIPICSGFHQRLRPCRVHWTEWNGAELCWVEQTMLPLSKMKRIIERTKLQTHTYTQIYLLTRVCMCVCTLRSIFAVGFFLYVNAYEWAVQNGSHFIFHYRQALRKRFTWKKVKEMMRDVRKNTSMSISLISEKLNVCQLSFVRLVRLRKIHLPSSLMLGASVCN